MDIISQASRQDDGDHCRSLDGLSVIVGQIISASLANLKCALANRMARRPLLMNGLTFLDWSPISL